MLALLRNAGSFARVSPFSTRPHKLSADLHFLFLKAASAGQRRFLSIHEYQSVNLLNSVYTPPGLLCYSSLIMFFLVWGTNSEGCRCQVTQGGRPSIQPGFRSVWIFLFTRSPSVYVTDMYHRREWRRYQGTGSCGWSREG
jgi:hypothetical protein